MRTWSYLVNPILNATEDSMLIALKLSTYHDNALNTAKSDPFILALYNSYHPFHVALKAAYDAANTQQALKQGETLNIKQLLKLLSSTKIQQWDIKIQNAYPQSSVQYKKLLPNRRAPFQTGEQIERIRSVQSLSQAIGADKALVTLKAEIDSTYTLLEAAYNNQKSSINTTKTKSNDFETARIAMSNAQFANYGALIQKYAATPEIIAKYFDLSILHSSHQVLFTGHVKPTEVNTVVKHHFTDDDEIKINNLGTTAFQVYLAEMKNQLPTSAKVLSVAPGRHIFSIKDLGNIANTYVCLYNPDKAITAEFEVGLI